MSPVTVSQFLSRPRWCSPGFPYSAPGPRWGLPSVPQTHWFVPLVNSWLRPCSGDTTFSGCACVRPWSHTESLLTRYPLNRLWEFHQIYRYRCSWIAMNWLDFEINRSNVKVIARPHKHFARHFFSCFWNAWTYFNETKRIITCHQVCTTGWHFKVMSAGIYLFI